MPRDRHIFFFGWWLRELFLGLPNPLPLVQYSTPMSARFDARNIWNFHSCRWSDKTHSHTLEHFGQLISLSLHYARKSRWTRFIGTRTRNYVCLRISGECQTQTQEYHSMKSERCKNKPRKNTISGWLLHFGCEIECDAVWSSSHLSWYGGRIYAQSNNEHMRATADSGYGRRSLSIRHRINNNCMLKKFRRKNSQAQFAGVVFALDVIVVFLRGLEGSQPRNVNERKSFPSLLSHARQIFQYNMISNRKRIVKAQPVAWMCVATHNTKHDTERIDWMVIWMELLRY